jgi:hypothetical protein
LTTRAPRSIPPIAAQTKNCESLAGKPDSANSTQLQQIKTAQAHAKQKVSQASSSKNCERPTGMSTGNSDSATQLQQKNCVLSQTLKKRINHASFAQNISSTATQTKTAQAPQKTPTAQLQQK